MYEKNTTYYFIICFWFYVPIKSAASYYYACMRWLYREQIVDQNYTPNKDVKYLLCSPGFNVQLRQNGFSYDTYTDSNSSTDKEISFGPQNKPAKPESFTRHYHRVDINLAGCNTDAQIVGEDKLEAYYNYFTAGTPEGGVSNVHCYGKVIYKNIYPNIDLEFTTRPA